MEKKIAVPESLFALLSSGEKDGYQVHTGFTIELVHSLMGDFPAICKGSGDLVITFDAELAERIASLLPVRPAKILGSLFYVNAATGYCYELALRSQAESKRAKPRRFLTKEILDELVADEQQPFQWAPGLFGGNAWSQEQFTQAIHSSAVSAKELSV
jgi:hypothetical protein